MHVIANDGVRLYYERLGEEPRVLFVLNGYYLIDDFKYSPPRIFGTRVIPS